MDPTDYSGTDTLPLPPPMPPPPPDTQSGGNSGDLPSGSGSGYDWTQLGTAGANAAGQVGQSAFGWLTAQAVAPYQAQAAGYQAQAALASQNSMLQFGTASSNRIFLYGLIFVGMVMLLKHKKG